MLCEVVMESGHIYKVRSFIKNAKLIEFNDLLSGNVDLLAARPEQEGFIAIVMLPIQPGQSPDNQRLVESHVFEGDQLLS